MLILRYFLWKGMVRNGTVLALFHTRATQGVSYRIQKPEFLGSKQRERCSFNHPLKGSILRKEDGHP